MAPAFLLPATLKSASSGSALPGQEVASSGTGGSAGAGIGGGAGSGMGGAGGGGRAGGNQGSRPDGGGSGRAHGAGSGGGNIPFDGLFSSEASSSAGLGHSTGASHTRGAGSAIAIGRAAVGPTLNVSSVTAMGGARLNGPDPIHGSTASSTLGGSVGSGAGGHTSRHRSGAQLWQRLGRQISNFKIQEYGCRCLANMANEESNAAKIISVGGVPRLLSSLVFLRDFSRTAEYGLAALANLAFFEGNANVIISEGGARVIADVMNAHRSNARIQELALRCVVNLAICVDHVIVLRSVGLASLTVAAGSAYIGTLAVAEQSLKALVNFVACCTSIHETLRGSGGELFVEKCLAKHPGNQVITRAAARIRECIMTASVNPAYVCTDLCPSVENEEGD